MTHTTARDRTDVLVVGAGLAGLTAARRLAEACATVRVLEARDRVGGRTLVHTLDDGEAIDLGGQWVGPTQDRILALIEHLGLDTYPQHETGRKQLQVCGARRTYKGEIPSLPPLSLIDLHRVFSRLDALAAEVPLDAPYDAPRATEWDGMTVETWKRRFLRTKHARAVFDVGVEAIFAVEPADLSFLHFLFYLRSGGGLMRLSQIRDGAQQTRIRGGVQQIAERLAHALGDRVRLSAPVRVLERSERGVTARTDAGVFSADYAVLAVPPALAGRIDFRPALSPRRTQLLQRVPMGSVIKCIAVYETPFWREEGWSGEVVCDEDPVKVIFDDGPPEGSYGALLGFMAGRSARAWSGRDPAERRAVVLDRFARFFGPKAARPVHYVDHDWSAETWSAGCYVGLMPPGVMTAYGDLVRAPEGRLHWAGTETATVWNGYLDGAVRSGERAADEVLARLHADEGDPEKP